MSARRRNPALAVTEASPTGIGGDHRGCYTSNWLGVCASTENSQEDPSNLIRVMPAEGSLARTSSRNERSSAESRFPTQFGKRL